MGAQKQAAGKRRRASRKKSRPPFVLSCDDFFSWWAKARRNLFFFCVCVSWAVLEALGTRQRLRLCLCSLWSCGLGGRFNHVFWREGEPRTRPVGAADVSVDGLVLAPLRLFMFRLHILVLV